MSIERKLLAACIKSREAFEKIEDGIDKKLSLPIAELILDSCREYYARDGTAKYVDVDYILEHITTVFDNQKKAKEYQEFVLEINALDVSVVNIVSIIQAAKRKEAGHRLAAALANDSKDVSSLIEEYSALNEQGESEDASEIYHNLSIEESVSTILNKDNLIKLPTRALNEAIDGGAMAGNHIVIYARPETGKTALCISCLRAFAYQELDGIYFGNEDPIRSVILRAQCGFSGLTKEQIRDRPHEAQKLLDATGFRHVRFIPLNPGTPQEIIKYIKLYKPKWIIIDQIRNLYVRSDTRVNQLEASATAVRNIANRYNLLAISITQAGDSADQKLVLSMGDIDFSNTGIPAQSDVMIGMGVNADFEEKGQRMISLPKNKLGGVHTHFPVRINQFISRIEDI